MFRVYFISLFNYTYFIWMSLIQQLVYLTISPSTFPSVLHFTFYLKYISTVIFNYISFFHSSFCLEIFLFFYISIILYILPYILLFICNVLFLSFYTHFYLSFYLSLFLYNIFIHLPTQEMYILLWLSSFHLYSLSKYFCV